MSLLIFFRHGARKRTSILVRIGRSSVRIIRYRPIKSTIRYFESFLLLIESEKREYALICNQKTLNFESANTFEFMAESRNTYFKSNIEPS